ncbi:hypothetical protein HanIR_Chr05g0244441 [Helianthus annuus]|nr:hypothetical protein HanIR_Chr05g0244441 [Helianthus annuus]
MLFDKLLDIHGIDWKLTNEEQYVLILISQCHIHKIFYIVLVVNKCLG